MAADDAESATTPPPDQQHHRITCHRCAHVWEITQTDGRVSCPACGTTVSIGRGALAAQEDNVLLTALAAGPKTRAELDPAQPWNEREFVRRLKPPTAGRGSGKSRPGPHSRCGVYYLEGDERAAMRRFIDVNEAYVADCLADSTNPLVSNWPEWLWTLLLEQWHLDGYAAAHRDD